jgi:uncharacterized protein (DUF302 family)
MIPDGLISLPSAYSVSQTIDRAHSAITSRGITVFARIDHAAGAQAVGLELRPTQVLIFGNAAAGTPLMQADQSIAIDLPLRFLAYEDESGTTQLTFYSPEYLAARHGVENPIATKMTAQITQLAHEIAKAEALL